MNPWHDCPVANSFAWPALMTAAHAVHLEAQAPAPSTYIGPLTGSHEGS